MKRISKTEIKEMRSQSKKNSIMFAFTLPTVILYTIFFLVTMLIGVYYSFTDWNGISKDYTFVGLKNYVKVLTDERFREALWFNIGYTIALVVLLIVIPLTIALALNRIRRLSTLFRSIYFIPAVISMVTVGLIWNELFYRAVPAIGEMLNIEALSTSPLGNPKLAAIAIMVVIDNTNYYTKVEDAVRFVEQTGCDSLAIAVGNAHGPYVKTPNLDLERIYAIRKKVNIPLVLHGCSDIPEEQMKEAVNLGMSKFNIATEYFRTMYQSIEKRINNQEFEGNGVKLMYDIKEEMIDFVIQKIRLLNPNKYSM